MADLEATDSSTEPTLRYVPNLKRDTYVLDDFGDLWWVERSVTQTPKAKDGKVNVRVQKFRLQNDEVEPLGKVMLLQYGHDEQVKTFDLAGLKAHLDARANH